MSDATGDVTGWTFAIGGDSVFAVTDPQFEREQVEEGGWTTGALADRLDTLVDGNPTRTERGGLLGEILDL